MLEPVTAMAQSGGSGSGRLKWSHPLQSVSAMRSDITAVIARRVPVLLGIGGGDDGGITVRDDQHADFAASLHTMVRRYGFTGVDIDLEPSGRSWTEGAVVAAVRQLKKDFGAIGSTVGFVRGISGELVFAGAALGADVDVDYSAPMLCDFPEAHDDRQAAKGASDLGRPALRGAVGTAVRSWTRAG